MRSTRRRLVLLALWITLTSLGRVGGPCRAAVGDDVTLLRSAGLKTDGDSLLRFFRGRMRADPDTERLEALVRDLGAPEVDVRQRAFLELVTRGVVATPWLRKGINGLDDPEVARQARECLRWIEKPGGSALTAAAVRVLGERRPEGAAEALLSYLPFAEDEGVSSAIHGALHQLAFPDGKAAAALLRGLEDPVPVRRAVAGEALCRADKPEQFPNVRKLLNDPKPAVRLRAAVALAKQQDPEAIPVLIDRNPERASRLRPEEVEELLSLQGTGGPLTSRGVEHFVALIERKRPLLDKVQAIAGTEYLDLLEQIVALLYEKVQPYPDRR